MSEPEQPTEPRVNIADPNYPIYPHKLCVRCRHARSKFRSVNNFCQWLLCWPDPYDVHTFPIMVAIWGLGTMMVDIGTDIWVATSHFRDGHHIWAGLTVGFVLLPCAFAFSYSVLYQRYFQWFQVHPVGPFYWSWKAIKAMKRQWIFRSVSDKKEATMFLHYTHEVARYELRNRYSSADETYLESFPEVILQGYFIARLMMDLDTTEVKGSDEVNWEMWLSVVISALSIVSYESTVAYHRHFVNNAQIYEPCVLDIIFRILFDLLTVFPRVASIACLCTVEPKEYTVPSFLVFHLLVAFIFFYFTGTRKVFNTNGIHVQSHHEEYRGYKSHRSQFINNLRATVVSVLFPPTCGWHEKNGGSNLEQGSSTKFCWNGVHLQFIIISTFQILESTAMFGLWLYFNGPTIKKPYHIIIPTVALGFLILRPFSDLICQIVFLSPLTRDEEKYCPRFRGVLAKTRILQMGSDIVSSFSSELTPRLINLEQLFSHEITPNSAVKIRENCQWIYKNLTPDRIVQRQRKELYQTNLEADKMASSPGPKTEFLFTTVGLHDVEVLRNVMTAAQRWETLSDNPQEVVQELRSWIESCRGKVEVWERVFVACLTFQKLPKEFVAVTENPDANHRLLVESYDHLTELNRELRFSHVSLSMEL